MKACRLFIDTKFIADKLGVKPNQIAFGDIEGNHSTIEFTVLVDECATVKEDVTVEPLEPGDVELRKSNLLRGI